MNIPFVDLKSQYQSIKGEIDGAIANVIADTAFISGKCAKTFEEDYSSYSGLDHVIACANGTDSLEILLQAMGIGPGDEVLVPALTWISTSEAVGSLGAKAIFVDINEYFTIDASQIEAKITDRTKAIIPVHIYGQPADMKRIMDIAKKHKLKVLEDCAQAHGAELDGIRIANFGDCGSFSFYPGKNLGAYGDSGGMVTNDADIAARARMIANHGQLEKHNHIMEGRNSRMDGIQAAILSVKLKYIELWTERRRANARYYDSILNNIESIEIPKCIEDGWHVYHLYVIRCKDRDGLKEHLEGNGISTGIHYPHPLPAMKCYEDRNLGRNDFPKSYAACDEILSIPMYPELEKGQMDYVADKINEYYQ